MALFAARERAMVSGLRRQLGELSGEAAHAHPTGFWGNRAGRDVTNALGDPDVAALRLDADVVAAFDTIRSAPTLTLHAQPGLVWVPLPVVNGHTVVLRDHLVVPAFPDGIRYLRNVDLKTLADLAPRHTQIPALYEAYCAQAGVAPLGDVLGALAVLLGKQMLRLA